MAGKKLLIYLLRRDLRVSDNPIFHHLATAKDHGFTHLLPLYIFPAHQVEISGFIDQEEVKSPYPQARSAVGGFWRCGPHRAKFLGQSVWDLKTTLESLNSGLVIRVGKQSDVLGHLLENFKDKDIKPSAVWMTEERSYEEVQEQQGVAEVCEDHHVDFQLWSDEKYLIDDRDTGLEDPPKDLPNIFTVYRKTQEPLRERPRDALPLPAKDSLPSFPESSAIPGQFSPFTSAQTREDLESRLLKPLNDILRNPPPLPDGATSSHPFEGGESHAWERLKYLITSDSMSTYHETRNGLAGVDFSTKLSAFLSLGCISARQIHHELVAFEDGTKDDYKNGRGYGQGENDGTKAIRFELLWRDYMHLCESKFGTNLFKLDGFRQETKYKKMWLAPNDSAGQRDKRRTFDDVAEKLERFYEGTTGQGFIDASQRELFHTGYTSNRARQNVASFLTKHLDIDWRYGAEWYECMLVDYDVSSNWSNWQYVAGVGNDPRGDARVFNPVKQAFDYDKDGSFTKMWIPEIRGFTDPSNIFQAWTAKEDDIRALGLSNNVMVTDPLKRITFTPDRRPNKSGRGPAYGRGKGNGRGRGGGRGGRGGGGGGGQTNGNSGSRGYHQGTNGQTNGSSRNSARGGRGSGRGWRGGGSPEGSNGSKPRSSDDRSAPAPNFGDSRVESFGNTSSAQGSRTYRPSWMINATDSHGSNGHPGRPSAYRSSPKIANGSNGPAALPKPYRSSPIIANGSNGPSGLPKSNIGEPNGTSDRKASWPNLPNPKSSSQQQYTHHNNYQEGTVTSPLYHPNGRYDYDHHNHQPFSPTHHSNGGYHPYSHAGGQSGHSWGGYGGHWHQNGNYAPQSPPGSFPPQGPPASYSQHGQYGPGSYYNSPPHPGAAFQTGL